MSTNTLRPIRPTKDDREYVIGLLKTAASGSADVQGMRSAVLEATLRLAENAVDARHSSVRRSAVRRLAALVEETNDPGWETCYRMLVSAPIRDDMDDVPGSSIGKDVIL